MRKAAFYCVSAAIALSLLVAGCRAINQANGDEVLPSSSPIEELSTPASINSGDPQEGSSGQSGWSCEDPFEAATLRFRVDYWSKTDFCRHSVPLSEFRSGGPPPDGILPIDNPMFVNQTGGDEWLGAEWPVIAFEHQGQARAYPLAMLLLHEIVNDEVAGLPIAVTYCPLCNAAIVFDRRVQGTILDFGTTGNLRNSDLVMYDRQTQSWWQQLTGEGVVGEYSGAQLSLLPSRILAWQEFKNLYQQGEVLARASGIDRFKERYGTNPYPGLDSSDTSPFGVISDDRLQPMERVAAFQLEGRPFAYPFTRLQQEEVVNDELGTQAIVVFWQPGVRSAVDSRQIGNSRQVGSSAVYRRTVADRELIFEPIDEPGLFLDVQTGSRWNMLGEAISGPLAGEQLEQVISAEHFWFAWSAFYGDVEIRLAEDQ